MLFPVIGIIIPSPPVGTDINDDDDGKPGLLTPPPPPPIVATLEGIRIITTPFLPTLSILDELPLPPDPK